MYHESGAKLGLNQIRDTKVGCQDRTRDESGQYTRIDLKPSINTGLVLWLNYLP